MSNTSSGGGVMATYSQDVSDEDFRMLAAVADHMERKDESPQCAKDLRRLAEKLRARELQQAQVVGECQHEWTNTNGVGGMARRDLFCIKCGKQRTPQSSAPVVGDALRAAAQAVVIGKVNPSAGRTRLVMLKDVQALESALTGRGNAPQTLGQL